MTNEDYMELRQLDEQIKQMNTHLENIEEQIQELNSAKVILNKFSELAEGDELRVPIANGIYIKAELMDVEKLMVNVGAGVTVEKGPKEVIKILDGQLVELSEYRENVVGQMKQLIERVEKLQG